MIKLYRLQFILLITLICASGCSINRVSQENFNLIISKGDFETAQSLSTTQAKSKNTHQNLVWILQAAAIERILQNYHASNALFDRADQRFGYFDQRLLAGRSVQTAKSILFNDSILPYVGKNHDRIMVNTYKALNYAMLGDKDNARVEFNRALQRQNDAKSLFEAQARSLEKKLDEERQKPLFARSAIDESIHNPQLTNVIDDTYANLDRFQVYTDFVNPFTTYIAGLFFWLEGDTSKAVDILKEAKGMIPSQSIVSSDFRRAKRNKRPHNEMWIIVEDGLAPQRQEIRVDLPILSPHFEIQYVGAAFPTLTAGVATYTYIHFLTSSGKKVTSEYIADMTSIMSAEFKKELSGVITREVARLAVKTYLQYQMHKEYGLLGSVLAGIYQASTTAVDLRTWSSLPQNFQVAHMDIPADRTITMRPSGGDELTINIPSDCDNVILYIRLVTVGSKPIYDFIKF